MNANDVVVLIGMVISLIIGIFALAIIGDCGDSTKPWRIAKYIAWGFCGFPVAVFFAYMVKALIWVVMG